MTGQTVKIWKGQKMMFCTHCGNGIKLFSTVKVALEIDYGTGLYISHRNICQICDREIAKKNDMYRDFVQYFSEHPGKLEALEAIHERELQL